MKSSKGKNDRNLYICRKECKAKADERKVMQPVCIELGDIVQFRFESPRHFRTINEEYFYVSKEVWEDCFVCVGEVWDDICWQNQATLEEIMRLKLYNQNIEQKSNFKKYKENRKIK